MPSRAMLTGASGFVGSRVLDYLLKETDWTFVCPCSFRHRGNPFRMKPSDRVEVVTLDLTGVIPDMGSCDYIVHMAAESSVDRSISDPVPFIENNVSSTLQVLEYARRHEPKVFLNFSTDEVFGASEHGEWDVLLPANPYSASKAAAEMVAISYWRTYGVPVVITNTNNIVGEGQDPEKFVPKIVDLVRKSEEVTIHVSNGQPGRRYYNPAENVAAALLFILRRHPQPWLPNKQVDRPDRYSIPGGKELDNLEMARLIAELMGKELKYKLVDVEKVRRGYDEFYPKTDGRLTELGFEPPLTLREGLRWVK